MATSGTEGHDLSLEQRLELSTTWQASLAVTQRLEDQLRELKCPQAAAAVANAVQALKHVQRQLTEIRELDDEGNTDENTP